MPSNDSIHRRPIAARSHSLSRRVSRGLVAVGASANGVSMAGLACAGVAGGCLALTPGATDGSIPVPAAAFYLGASLLIPARLLANMLDGLVAVEHGKHSPTGELYNEIPDRLSDVAVLVGAGYSAGAHPWLGFVAALLSLLVTYIRSLGRSLGFPSDFRGPMAKQQRMVLVAFACLVLAIRAGVFPDGMGVRLPEPLRSWGVMDAALAAVSAGCLATAWRRLCLLALRLRQRDDTSQDHDHEPPL